MSLLLSLLVCSVLLLLLPAQGTHLVAGMLGVLDVPCE